LEPGEKSEDTVPQVRKARDKRKMSKIVIYELHVAP